MINRRKREKLQKDILDLISSFKRPLSTQEVADNLGGKPWHSVQTRCLMLQVEGKVEGFRVGRMNLWQINLKSRKKEED